MRKFPGLFVAAMLAISMGAGAARSGVILSELCDPRDYYPTDRFIEIYNTGASPVDLTGWRLIAIANGVNVCTWPLSGTLAAGQAKVAGTPAPATAFTVNFQNSVWATPAGYMNWNGKVGDGAKLLNADSVTVDSVIAIGTLFENADLVRAPSVTTGSLGYVAAQWTSQAVILATNASPGTHNGSPPPPAGPAVSNVVTDPAVPVTGAGVDVQATVVDTSGPLVSVTLAWGTSSASQPNAIEMTLLSGNTYRTSAPIPAQAPGAQIWYQVQAEGASGTGQSSLLSYTLAGGGSGAPTVLAVGEMSDSTLLVTFSEPVEETSAETPANYTVGALVAVDAVRDSIKPAEVLITVRSIPAGTRTLSVSGVADLSANTAFGVTRNFNYVDVTIPAGYYASTNGLIGSALRRALHILIRNHTVISYSGALTAFGTTDIKPNGKIWDPYSDVPGGTPPYEYNFGQTGQGATEGLGYNREHSFPQSWFGSQSNSAMYSDLWHLYPTDAKVNGYRANYAYGKVATASITSWNGSKVGPSASVGFSGTVFEPIDAFKGDLMRSQFYMATRYFGQDAGWPNVSDSFSGAEMEQWAVDQYRAWSTGDPVSWKERMRNGAIYVLQHNRNPFVDHPEFIAMIYDSNNVVSVGDPVPAGSIRLRQNLPNPFGARTTIGFDLARRERVTLGIYDVSGRRVRTLENGRLLESGSHEAEWNGRDDRGTRVETGLYFCRLEAGPVSQTRRIVFAR